MKFKLAPIPSTSPNTFTAMNHFNWADTELGDSESWDENLSQTIQYIFAIEEPLIAFIGPQSRIIYNDAMVKLLQVNLEPTIVLGAPAKPLPGDLYTLIKSRLPEVTNKKYACEFPHQEVKKDISSSEAKSRYFTCKYFPILDEHRKIMGITVSVVDTTAQFLIQQNLCGFSKIEMENVRDTRNFIEWLTHEIRNGLSSVLGIGEILDETIGKVDQFIKAHIAANDLGKWDSLGQELHKYLLSLNSASNTLRIVANNVLDSSKLREGKTELHETVCDIKEIIDEVCRGHALQCEKKGIDLKSKLDIQDSLIKADDAKIRQILANCIGNSLKFTEKGYICVKLTEPSFTDTHRIFEFEIEDTGCGLTEEEISHLFSPYSQANPSVASVHGGSGMGLYITKGYLELMGGSIQVTSTKNTITTFKFSVKVKQVALEERQEFIANKKGKSVDQPNSLKRSLSSKTILIVEDEAINMMLLQNFLREYVCLCATDGEMGLKLFQENASDIALVLTDLGLPKKNGFQVAQGIREIEKNVENKTPIICISATPESKELALNAGMNAFLDKPYTKQQIAEILALYLQENPPTPKHQAGPSFDKKSD